MTLMDGNHTLLTKPCGRAGKAERTVTLGGTIPGVKPWSAET